MSTWIRSLVLGLCCMCGAGAVDRAQQAWLTGYPHFRGPDSSGAAQESGLELVKQWPQARLLWCSELRNPLTIEHTVLWAHTVYPPWPMNCENNGSFSGVAVANDRAYVAFWRPTGTARVPRGKGMGTPTSLIDADDCLACIDAKTGRTLWVTAFENCGANLIATGSRDSQITPCVADGKVFFLGSIGRLYCVDALTGEKCWDLVATNRARVWEFYKADLMAGRIKRNGQSPPPKHYDELLKQDPPHPELGGSGGRNFNSTPVVCGDVAVFGVGGTCVGVEIATGKPLWRHTGVMATASSPLIWTHKGEQYVIAYGGGRLNCIHPRTGAFLWRYGPVGGGYQGHTPAITGDYLICTARVSNDRKADMFIGGFRLSLDGPEVVWKFPPKSRLTYHSPAAYRNRFYFLAKGFPEVFPKACTYSRSKAQSMLYAVEADTGRCIGVAPGRGGCASLLVMDERVFFSGNCRNHIWGTEPDEKGHLPVLSQRHMHNADSTTPSGCGGFLFRRGVGNMVYCWDLRQPVTAQAQPKAEGPATQAAWQLDLHGAMPDRRSLRLHLLARDGSFPQAWMSLDDHVMPELAWADGLQFDGQRLHGTVRCWLSTRTVAYNGKYLGGGRHYTFNIDVTFANGAVQGRFTEAVIGRTHYGKINGRNASFVLKDEHHVDPTSGQVTGVYADDLTALSQYRHDVNLAAAVVQVQALSATDVPALSQVLRESSYPHVRRLAIGRLARVVSPLRYKAVYQALDQCAKQDSDLSVRLTALRAMVHNGNQLPLLIPYLQDPEALVRQGALLSIARILEKTRAEIPGDLLPALLGRVKDDDLRVRAGAINAIGHIGPSAVMALVGLMTTEQELDLTEECLRALDRASRTLPVLPSEQRDQVRKAVFTAINRDGIEAAPRSRGLSCLKKTGEAALSQLSQLAGADFSAAVRQEALTQIGDLGSSALSALPVVQQAAASEHEGVRKQAFIAMGKLCDHELNEAPVPQLSQSDVRYLFGMLSRSQGYVPDSIIWRSTRILGLVAPVHQALLLELLPTADARQTEGLIEALAYLGPKAKRLLPKLQAAAARHPSEDMQETLAKAVARIEAEEETP